MVNFWGRLAISVVVLVVGGAGTHQVMDGYNGTRMEHVPYPIVRSRPNQYIWQTTLNYGESNKAEYDFGVVDSNGVAGMIVAYD